MAKTQKLGIQATPSPVVLLDDNPDDYIGDRWVLSAPPAAPPAPEPSGLMRRVVGDGAVTLLKGAIGVPEAAVGLADMVSGGHVGKFLENGDGSFGFRPEQAKAFLDEFYSPEQRAAFQAVQQAPNPEDPWYSRAADIAGAAVRNPSTIVHAVGESLPVMGAGGVLARGAMAIAPRIPGFAAAGIGEGAVTAGSTAEQVRQQTPDGLLDAKQAAVSAGVGALTGGIGAVAARAAKAMGIGDIDVMIAGGKQVDPNLQKGFVRRLLEGALTEGVMEELPQSIQEQVGQNYALGKPLDEGVDQAAVMGLLTGGAMGVGAQVLHKPGAGPLTRAADLAAAGGVPPVAPTAPPAPGAAPTAPTAATAPPAPSSPEDDQRLLDWANKRRDELELKAKGRKGKTIPGPDGKPIKEPDVQPEFLTPGELKEREFLEQAGGDINALRRAYQPLVPAIAKRDPDAAIASMERTAAREENAALGRSKAAAADETPDEPVQPPAAAAPAPAADAEDLPPPDQDDVLNPQGEPFKSRGAALRKLANLPEKDAYLLTQVAGGYVLRRKAAEQPVEPGSTSSGFQVGQTWGKEGRGTYRITEVSPDGQRARADFGNGETVWVHHDTEIVNGWAPSAAAPVEPAPQGDGRLAEITAAANEAAPSPTNDRPEPSDAQKEAGNYKKGHVRISGLDVTIENDLGSTRRSKADAPTPWEVQMPYHYGYIKRTTGADGDHVDIGIGPKGENGRFWIINQHHDGKPDAFDEHKVFTGVDSADEAVDLYKRGFADNFGERVFSSISDELSADELKAKLPDLKKAKPVPAAAPATPDEKLDQGIADFNKSVDDMRAAGAEALGERPVESQAPAPAAPAEDSAQARWTRATEAERIGMLGRAGWSVTPQPSLSAQRILRQPWDKLSQSQKDRITAALDGAAPPAAAPAPAEPEVTSSQQPLSDAEVADLERMLGHSGAVTYKDMGGHWRAEGTGGSLRNPVRVVGSTREAARRNLLAKLRELRESAPEQASPQGDTGTKSPTGDTAPASPEKERAAAIKAFGEAMRAAGLDMDGVDVRSWSANVGERGEIHATLTDRRDGTVVYDVRSMLDGKDHMSSTGVKLDAATAAVKEFRDDLIAEEAKAKAPAPAPQVQPSANTIFTEDAAEKARAVLKRKLGQLSSGIDPEILQAGITLAGYHIERGARKFAAYAKAMIAELGDDIKPYLKSFYMAVKYDPRAAAFAAELSSAAEVEAADLDEKAPAAAGPTLDTPEGRAAVAQRIADRLIGGDGFATIVEARKFIGEIVGKKIEPATRDAKLADETVENAVVLAGREIVQAARKQGRSDEIIYDRLVALYKAQPNLSVRSSTSVREQAYSTPVPLAFLASRLARVTPQSRVGEPTAGNGMLMIEVPQANAVVNELNADRAGNLRALGFQPTTNNAATTALAPAKSLDAEIMNPPFGTTKDDEVRTITYDVLPNYRTIEVDHAIAFKALEALKDDGNAVLIVGGVDESDPERIREAYRGKGKREFYFHLYQNYKVVDHFTVDGDLYSRQGAGYPVDVVVIRGRGKATRTLPAADLPQRFASWEDLKEKLNGADSVEPAGDRPGTGSGDGSPRGADGGAVVVGTGRPTDDDGAQGAGPRGGDARGGDGAGSAGARQPGAGRGSAAPAQPQPANGNDARGDGTNGPVPGPGVAGQQRGQRSDAGDRPADVAGDRKLDGERLQSGLSDRRGQEQETATQVAYTPRSATASVGTLVPVNMRDAIQASLARVADEVGDLDAYVAKALDFKADELGDYFSAEQVDALALAIYNAEQDKGFIIGDQTGIGKGRVVAGMIRFAIKRGVVPVFVTEKPNLYADMIRDLDDIGMAEDLGLESGKPAILITNGSERIPYTLQRQNGDEVVEHNFDLRAPASGKALDTLLDQMVGEGELGDYKVIFTTYNQLQTVKGKTTARMRFVQRFGDRGYMIFDESHNAGGNNSEQARTKEQRAQAKAGETTVTGRASFVRGLVRKAGGSFFSSATYAKRPDVMDLYSSTNMLLAVNRPADLGPAIKQGGVPMQQIVATMLTEDGQYIRRERTFAGVTYETRSMTVDRKTAENMATAMRRVLEFSRAKEAAIKELQKAADREAARVQVEGEKTQVQGANFGAIMHNLIDQMLLSLKSKDSVTFAIERLRAGEKVVLTVSNTMGSFLKDYAEQMGLRTGEPVALTFKDLYQRYLEKQRWVRIKSPGGSVTEHRLTDDELGERTTRMFNDIQEFLEGAGFGDAPISPIDYLHTELRKAGFKTDEITGRTITLNYETGTPKLATRQASIKQRLTAIKGFNGGTIDALILNQSGSTGLSLHASAKVKDQRPRRMIVVQAEKNIDTHMQMLGRVHRTGQVVVPAYTQAMADIPAETRPAAVLLKKMASLNANTTASRKSAVTAEGVVDFMNDYGGQVVHEFLMDNPDIHAAVGGNQVLPLADDPSEATEDDIRKLTGYIPILPIDVQEQVYADLIERYNELIAREDSMGTNKLEARALDLDAKPISSETITAPKKGDSRFAAPANMERLDVKRTVKPMTGAEVQQLIDDGLAGKTPQQHADALLKDAVERTDAYRAKRLQELRDGGADQPRVQREDDTIRLQLGQVRSILTSYPVGSPVTITDKSGAVVYGVVTSVSDSRKTKNPAAGSSWKMTLALANGDARSIPINFGQIGTAVKLKVETGNIPAVAANGDTEWVPIRGLFDRGATVRREKRWMVTGNILAGFSQFQGQIVNYTKEDGTIGQGVLMPRSFDFNKAKEKAKAVFSTVEQIEQFFAKAGPGAVVATEDSALRIVALSNGGLDFLTPSSKKEGGTYYLDQQLIEEIGSDFYKSGQTMRARVHDRDDGMRGVRYLLEERDDVKLTAFTHQKTANEVLGIGQPKPEDKPMLRRGPPVDGRMTVDRVQIVADRIAERWANAPEIVVARDMDDPVLPEAARREAKLLESVGDAGVGEAFFYPPDGKVYIIASQLGNVADVHRVLMHESLGHYGLRGTYGDELGTILDRLSTLNAGRVRAAAERLGYDFDKVAERRMAAEEVLAYMAENEPTLGWVQRAVAAVRSWLRNHIPGFGQMALSDNEIIRDYILPARNWVKRGPGGGPRGGGKRPLFSRALANNASGESPASLEAQSRVAAEAAAGRTRVLVDRYGNARPLLGVDAVDRRARAGEVVLQRGVGRNEWTVLSQGDDVKASGVARAMAAAGARPLFSMSTGLRGMKLPAGYLLGDLFNATAGVPGRLGWWHKTVGSMYHLAQRQPAFRRVYDAVQDFLNDVSYYAAEAADLAPTILPKLENFRDIWKSPLSAEDTKALSAPIFEGTLAWVRDHQGRLKRLADAEEELGARSLDDKAHMLIRGGHVAPDVLRMWQGLPIEQYEKIIEGKFERHYLKAGVVFTPAELREHFGLTDAQIGHYQEFRRAIAKSLTNLAVSDMLRYGGKDVAELRERVLAAPNADDAALLLRDHLFAQAEADPGRADLLNEMGNKMIDKADRAKDLIERGYAPLSRFGQYTLDVVDSEGKRLYFGLFESAMERSKMARKLAAEFPDAAQVQGTISNEAYKLFAGVSPETLELFGEMLGLESDSGDEASKAFQTYLQVARSSRDAMKRLIKRKGIAGFSEDAGRVLAGFIYSNARQTASNLHMKELDAAVNDIPKGDGQLQDAAVKLRDYVKNPQEEAQAFRGLLFAQYLGGSVASAIVNASQPFAVTFPYLSQWGGVRKAAQRMAAAVKDATKDSTGDAALDAALKKAEEEGIVSPQEVHALQAQAMGRAQLKSGDGTTMGDATAKANNALSKLSLAWGKVFGLAEQFNRKATFIAAYRTAVEQGIENPAKFAERAVAETQFTYNKGNKPRWARGAVGSVLFTFKQYSVNYVELLYRMATAGEPGSPERAAGRRAAVLALAVLFLMAGADGLPFAEDVQDVIDGAMQRLGYSFSSKQQLKQFLAHQIGQGGAEFVMHGVSGIPGVPIDVSGRLGMGNLIPGTGILQKKPDHTRDLLEVAGVAGDFGKRALTAADKASAGEVGSAIETMIPVAARNWAKAYDMAVTGMYRDEAGRKVLDVSGGEAIAKAIGFQPRDVARVQQASVEVQAAKGRYNVAADEIRDKWALGIFEGDQGKVAEARADLARWNENNPDQKITANMPSILKRVREMRKTKAQRIADTAPKAIRERARAAMAEAEE